MMKRIGGCCRRKMPVNPLVSTHICPLLLNWSRLDGDDGGGYFHQVDAGFLVVVVVDLEKLGTGNDSTIVVSSKGDGKRKRGPCYMIVSNRQDS